MGILSTVKFQVAFFEQFGSAGFSALERSLCRATDLGLRVIADAKRSDIGSSMAGYARAWVANDSPFRAAAVTVSPFMGVEGLAEVAEIAAAAGRTVFVLVATSNPEGRSIQAGSGKSLAFQILSAVNLLQETHHSLGVVIGANLNLREYGLQRIKAEALGFPILAPGFGHQGARLSTCSSHFGLSAEWVIPNVGRSVLTGNPECLPDRLTSALEELL
jgi:orotidine-5'-phosphate decarboxylase